MAFGFVPASSQYLVVSGGPPVAARPYTFFAFVKRNTISAVSASFFGFGDSGSSTAVSVTYEATSTINNLEQVSSGASGTATSIGVAPQGVWGDVLSECVSNVLRKAYYSYSSSGSSATDVTMPILDVFHVGTRRYSGSLGAFADHDIAEMAFWSVILTDNERLSLSKGFKPHRVRPQSLVFYSPMVRELQDLRGGKVITNTNGATVAPHPRMY